MSFQPHSRLYQTLFLILILTMTACSGLSEEDQTATALQQATNNAYATQTATLWTDTPTPTATFTATNTLTPTATFTLTNTPTPTATFTLTNTLTPSDTPTETHTFTPTNTATNTLTPSDTPTPTNTLTPSKTPTPTATATYTPIAYTINGNRAVNARECAQVSNCQVLDTISGGDTIYVVSVIEGDTVSGSDEWLELNIEGTQVFVHSSLASIAPTATPTRDPDSIQIEIYYVTANRAVNIRSCASTDCGIVATFNRGDALSVVGYSEDWYELQLDNGDTGYIADFLIGINKPSALPTAVPVRSTAIPQQQVQSTPIPQQQIQPTQVPQQIQPTAIPPTPVPVVQPTIPPAPAFTCDCGKTCGAMTCDEAYFQLNTCGCSRRDGDNDGVPCEAICPGG